MQLSDALVTGMEQNNIPCLVQRMNASTGQNCLYCGAMTVNKFPLLVELRINADASVVNVLYRVPVQPIKPMFEDALKFILKRQE